jgi:hypothetical protein
VLISASTRQLAQVEVTDLGEHRLKDFAEPVPIFQQGLAHFPPLKTISNTNLPRPASSFVGRNREVAELTALMTGGVGLVTLTFPGGSGKSRLAIAAAGELVPTFKAGVFWVGLAALRDPALVTAAVAQTLGAKRGLTEHIGRRELLLVLDNLEQVVAEPVELWPGSGLLSRRCCRAGIWVNGISGLGVSGSCGGEYQAVIQRGHLDNRGPALAMTRCHAGFSRILSRAPTNPATISVASSSERVSSRASSLSLASNWRASSCRVTLSHLPRSSSPAAGGNLAAAPRSHQVG